MTGGDGSADGHVQFPMCRDDGVFIGEFQGLLEPFPKNRLEREWTAKKSHFTMDRTAAGKAGNSLVYYGLKTERATSSWDTPSFRRAWISVLAKTPHREAMG